MPEVVSFAAPYDVALVACDPQPLVPGSVRLRTWYSGISAGTELTAYRGSNPYLTRTWDAERRLFVDGEPTFAYPVQGWGYSEVGEVVEVADDVEAPAVGDVVHGIWGHRSEAVVPAAAVRDRVWTADDAISGTFARVGSIALNAVLAAEARLGDRVAVFGQGVIGLLATRLAVLSGAEVVAVDTVPERLTAARAMGAAEVVSATVDGGAGAAIRAWSGGGVDPPIELQRQRPGAARGGPLGRGRRHRRGLGLLPGRCGAPAARARSSTTTGSGSWPARSPAPRSRSARAGTSPGWCAPSWTRCASGRVDVRSLVTDVVDAADVAAVFARLDRGDPEILQAVLRFPAAPEAP